MKKMKGFTLMELLIVVVIIGVLVTVALPKYKVALEKGRATEGVANARAVSEAVNAYYIMHNNSYGSWQALCAYAVGDNSCSEGATGGAAEITKNKFFFVPSIGVENGVVTVSVMRRLTGTKRYTITMTNQDGVLTNVTCTGYQPYCNILGLTGPGTTGSI